MSERLVRLLHAAYAAPDAGASDADLLARVAAGKDDAAFELLVRRHADLVWRVCRQTARDPHAAEDAFQATFLALARRAGVVREPAGFLHRVAVHAARKAKPRPTAALAADPTSHAPSPESMAATAELGPLLHAELDRLPDRLRLPVVLCHLEGFTQAEAAARLGWPVGTVATGVRRGFDRLRDRLARRGVGLPVAGAVLAASDAVAVPKALIRLAAGGGAGDPAVARLATAALLAMRYAQMKTMLWVSAACGLAAGGVAWSAGQPPQPAEPAKPAAPAAEKKPEPRYADYFDRKKAFDTVKRVGLVFHEYHDAKGHLPTDIAGPDGRKLLSWRVAILPYLDQKLLYSLFKLDEPWDSDHNKPLLRHVPDVLSDGTVPPTGGTLVKRFLGPGTMFEADKPVKIEDARDGLSNTLMAVSVGPPVPWTKPDDLPYDPAKPPPPLAGPYDDGFAVVFGDGSGRWLPPDADREFLRLLILRDDGKAIVWPPAKPGPPRPLTDREKRYLAMMREGFAQQRDQAERYGRELEPLRAAVRKFGPVAGPQLPAEDDLYRTLQAWQQIENVVQVEREETYRLWQELERRDPVAAAKLRKELEPKPAAPK
jgi:RNA polymerase sigma factor (sigma-70 family)